MESDGPKVKGFVVREISPVASNWRSVQSIQEYLEAAGIPGVEGVDTRAITAVAGGRCDERLYHHRGPVR